MATIIDMDRELPPKIYEWIGRISVAYGLYEHTLAATIKRTDPRHDILSAMKLAAALKSTTALQDRAAESFELWVHDQVKQGRFHDLLDRAREIAVMRNRVIHGIWAYEEKTDQLRWIHEVRDHDPETLPEIYSAITILTYELNQFTWPDQERRTYVSGISLGPALVTLNTKTTL